MVRKGNRMYEPWGYQEMDEIFTLRSAIDGAIKENEETDERQDEDIEDLKDGAVYTAEYDKDSESIKLKNQDGEVVSEIPMEDIIVSRLIKKAWYDAENKQIVIEFDNGDEIRIDVSDIADILNYGDGLVVDEDTQTVSVKLDENSEKIVVGHDEDTGEDITAPILSVTSSGISVSNVQDAIDYSIETHIPSAVTELIEALQDKVAELEERLDEYAKTINAVNKSFQFTEVPGKDYMEASIHLSDDKTENLTTLASNIENTFHFEAIPGGSGEMEAKMFIEGEWENVNTLLSELTNETFP